MDNNWKIMRHTLTICITIIIVSVLAYLGVKKQEPVSVPVGSGEQPITILNPQGVPLCSTQSATSNCIDITPCLLNREYCSKVLNQENIDSVKVILEEHPEISIEDNL